jgi:uncharacterized protein YceK
MLRIALTLTILMPFVSGCAAVVSPAAVCDGTAVLRTDHAAALAADAGPRSLATGARLIDAIDAGCAR